MPSIAFRTRLFRNAALLAVFCSIPAQGQSPAQSESEGQAVQEESTTITSRRSDQSDIWTRRRLTGDWGGLRTNLEESGFTLALTYQNVFQVNMHGGLETKNGHDNGGSYILGLEWDFEKMFDLRGASFFVETKGTYGGEAHDFDGEKIGGLFRTNQIADREEAIFINKWNGLFLLRSVRSPRRDGLPTGVLLATA